VQVAKRTAGYTQLDDGHQTSVDDSAEVFFCGSSAEKNAKGKGKAQGHCRTEECFKG
jgi:hypothetical protein